MILSRFLAVCLGLLVGFCAEGAATQARLVVPVETVKPGETITVGVLLEMSPGWHTYWKNPGDSGMATKITWTLPAGITAGEIQWPTPEIYEAADLVTYVHHDQAMLLVPLTIGAQVAAGDLDLKAKVSWLECEKLCVPGRTEVTSALKISSETKASSNAELIKKWQVKLPKTNETLKASARWEGDAKEDKRNLIIEFTPEANTADWDFFPYRGEDYSVSPKSEKLGQKKDRFILRKTISADEGKWPTEIKGLIAGGSKADKPTVAYEAAIAIWDSSSATNQTAAIAPSGTPDKKPEGNFWIKLLSAFIGGIILNFMPCVLPVISLKILSFVKQSQQDPARVRFLGLVYGAGVLASFLILAGLVIAVHKAGYLASWGMQFQNSKFLVVMIVLVTLVALNLFGLFEITLGGNVMNSASELAGKKGASGAFFNGLLTTVLATSCSAPILGSALSYAIFQPPLVIVLFFLTIGIGLAFPYVLLCWNPAWLKFLPKPGAWMEKFKIALGFPVLAVAIWLLDVAVAHYGRLTLWLGFFLVTLSLAMWVWGEFVQRGSKRRSLAMSIALAMLLTGYFYALEQKLNWRTPPAKAAGKQSRAVAADGIPWEPWSTEAVVAAQKAGRPVLVDFTADWCPNCQLNKVTSLEIPSTIAKLKELNFVSLIGDFTTEDPTIAAELRRHGRAAVPLVLVYPGIPGAEPIIMPELFTPGMIHEALDKVAPKQLTSVR